MGLVNRGWVPEQGHHALQQGTPHLAAGDTPCPQTGHSIYRDEWKTGLVGVRREWKWGGMVSSISMSLHINSRVYMV